jgi:hypothetical protein
LLLAVACAESDAPVADKFTNIDPAWAVTEDEAYEWALVKAANLPAITGSPEWNNYVGFLEEKLTGYGVVDLHHNSWTFDRWDTTDDPSGWTLVSDGAPVRVAHYATARSSSYRHGRIPSRLTMTGTSRTTRSTIMNGERTTILTGASSIAFLRNSASLSISGGSLASVSGRSRQRGARRATSSSMTWPSIERKGCIRSRCRRSTSHPG